jgi:hypothetical protein
MSAAVDAAIAAQRDRLVTAFWNQPAIRAALSMAEVTAAVDVALAEVALPDLLETVVAAQDLASAVQADVTTPPASVSTALGTYAPKYEGVNTRYNLD